LTFYNTSLFGNDEIDHNATISSPRLKQIQMSALCIIPRTRDANRSDPSYGATHDDHPIYHIHRVNWLIAIMDYRNHARDSNFQASLIFR